MSATKYTAQPGEPVTARDCIELEASQLWERLGEKTVLTVEPIQNRRWAGASSSRNVGDTSVGVAAFRQHRCCSSNNLRLAHMVESRSRH